MLYPSFLRKSVLLEFSTRLFQTPLRREGQGLLVQVSGIASLIAQQCSQHLAVAVLGNCHSAQPRKSADAAKKRSSQWWWLFCGSASPHLHHRNGHAISRYKLHTFKRHPDGDHHKNMPLVKMWRTPKSCGPRSQHICNTNPAPKAQETLEKRNGKTVRAGEPGRRSAMRQCLLHMTRSYAHEILTIWSPKQDLHGDITSWHPNWTGKSHKSPCLDEEL